ncbi:hypothetical protein UK23_09730 [Lentzea aerocolonigenes]|uniref:LamG-like jellyroll fold domain-containing protein n=1 Tax=Lentzea aerocolonigenes TaxID=68170 RepID=A0A0F0H732_LENAE|nr:beta-L-arabinofuranosidase domain-containing protein [Lentzea aerocolonigenes]KJK50666.1 hypothetical protein UK23_09730 [Lentzea aerocolonigenes]
MFTPSRRAVLRAGAVAVAAAALPARALAAARPDFGVSAELFPLGSVSLLPGPFRDNTLRTHAYLLFLDPDRLLHTFRLNVSLSSGVVPCGGWESPSTELRGHSTGHVLSALAQAFAATGDTAFSAKANYLVEQLAVCQDRARIGGFSTGYLSAFPESFIGRVEAREQVWAPYYTLHKIMAGLLDVHLLIGSPQALTVLKNMAAWAAWRNGRLTYDQRQNMLDTEFGGMNEVLANLYQLTGDPAHLTTAQYFDHAEIFDPLAQNRDALNGYHANTQIPKAIGAIREYHATGSTRYRDIASNFWEFVTSAHSYAIGGNSNGEYFKAPGRIASELSDNTCESCNSYNMLKLTAQLFRSSPGDARYFDFYEKTLYNHLLGAQNPDSAHGHHSYYTPLRPGGIRTYSNDYNDFTCCHGTGMETNTGHTGRIYAHSGTTLYVNLFIASTVSWRGFTVRQETSFPETAATKLTITGSGTFELRVRIPGWAAGAQIRVNGTPQPPVTPGSYAWINRTWSSGDVVDVSLPMALHRESTPDNRAVQAVRHGPIVLAGAYGTNNLPSMPVLQPSSIRATSTPLQYTASASTGQVTLMPFYKVHGQRYTVYWTVGEAPPFIAHYPFDGNTNDATGNGLTAALAGGAAWTAGRSGQAVDLSGSGAHVVLPSGLLAGALACTIATWVRLDTVTTWSRVFDFGSGTGNYAFLTPLSSAGGVRFAVTSGGAGSEQQINASAALPQGVWTHVAVTQNGDLGVLYVNGAEVARNTAMTARIGSTTQNWIGRSQYANDPYLDGAVDSFRVYGRALTAAEVANLHSTGT